MALSGGALAISMLAVIVAGIVTVVAMIAMYKCAKIPEQERAGGGDASPSTTGGGGEVDAGVGDAEMGSMSYFIEGLRSERPVRFTSQQLRGFTQSFVHRVGSGGFGAVYRGRFPGGLSVAVKVLSSTLGRRGEEQFMAEVGTIGRTYHVNLVRLYGFCFDPAVKALVYEYMENGSLDRHLFGPPAPEKTGLGFDKLHQIAVGTAKALRYLHEECSQRIIHYDIKPENVLLDAAMAPKVSDFGLAKLCDGEAAAARLTNTGARGTPGYAAPELWTPLPATSKCDVYSYGMLLFEMLGRRRNLELGRESREWYPRWVWRRLAAGEADAVLAPAVAAGGGVHRAARMCTVALWCVQHRPEDRPSMGAVVRMLEGDDDHIPAPANPFAHLAPSNAGIFNLSGEATTDESSASFPPSAPPDPDRLPPRSAGVINLSGEVTTEESYVSFAPSASPDPNRLPPRSAVNLSGETTTEEAYASFAPSAPPDPDLDRLPPRSVAPPDPSPMIIQR